MPEVSKHNREQEGESDDGVESCKGNTADFRHSTTDDALSALSPGNLMLKSLKVFKFERHFSPYSKTFPTTLNLIQFKACLLCGNDNFTAEQ